MIGRHWLLLFQSGVCLSKVQRKLYQTTMSSLLVPPSSVHGQKKICCEAFELVADCVPILLLPHKILSDNKDEIKKILLKLPNFKSIRPPEAKEDGKCIVYLDPEKLKDVTCDLKKKIDWDRYYCEKSVKFSYDNWTRNQILSAILPKDVKAPTSYSRVGHIVHMNLRDEQLPYKSVIGQVFLDKTPNVRTVVNKLDCIDNTYRNFAMEIIAGEENTVVEVKEHGFVYHFDFAKVYWNPRLATEHVTLVQFLKPGDVLYDVFAGVGPFAIPAASKGVNVLANDLNPESYKWLLKNAECNSKKSKNIVTAFNKDGRDFLTIDVKNDILRRRDENASGTEHLAMNLPAIAVQFLDVFKNWLNIEELNKVTLRPPIVHVYCFIKVTKTEDFEAMAKLLVEKSLDASLDPKTIIDIHHVRNVAPNKEMMRVSFKLTRDLLLSLLQSSTMRTTKEEDEEEPAKKIIKLSNNNLDIRRVLDNDHGKEQQAEKRIQGS